MYQTFLFTTLWNVDYIQDKPINENNKKPQFEKELTCRYWEIPVESAVKRQFPMIKIEMCKLYKELRINESASQTKAKSRTMKKTSGKMKTMFFSGGELSL
jgi:hypothetical protein